MRFPITSFPDTNVAPGFAGRSQAGPPGGWMSRAMKTLAVVALFPPTTAPGGSSAEIEINEIAPMTEEFFRHSEGAAVQLPNGTILLAWSRFYAEEGNPKRDDNAPANLVLARSTDNGRNWSSPEALDLPRGRINNMQASFLQVGEVTQLYYSKRNATGGRNAADKWMIESRDGGRTWSEPRQVTPGDRRYTGPNDRMLRLSTGRILLPCHTGFILHDRGEHAPVIFRSDDEGKSWEAGPLIQAEDEFYRLKHQLKLHEPALVERKDGSVWMLARTTNGRFFESESRDGGETWSTATPTAIKALTSPPQLKRLSDGRLLLVWNPYTPKAREYLAKGFARSLGGEGTVPGYLKRSLLAVSTSGDDGKTWSDPLVVADGGEATGYCYPAVLELEGEILIFASKTPEVIHPGSLVQIRVPLKELP